MKKTIAIILEIIPIVSAIMSFILMRSTINIKWLTNITFLFAFFGFIFFIIARKIYKDKIIKILGIFDILSTIYIFASYIVAIFVFGL